MELDTPVELISRETGATINRWLEYQCNTNFLTPCDGWSFTFAAVGEEGSLSRWTLADAGIAHGSRISVKIGGLYVADGYIDSIEFSAGRESGATAKIEGRDRLAYALDAHVDPSLYLKADETIEHALRTILGPYGFSKFEVAEGQNFELQTGLTRGIRTSEKGKPLKSVLKHQYKPYDSEGAFTFASRIVQRHGMFLWLSADGETVIAGRPNFEMDPAYTIRRRQSAGSNVLSGTVKFDVGSQPTILIAFGSSGGGEWSPAAIAAYAVNPALTALEDSAPILAKWPKAREVVLPSLETNVSVAKHRVLYRHDTESHNQLQIDNYVRREMGNFVRKGVTASYVVPGHGQLIDDQFAPWTVDTTVKVEDEVADLYETMWVVGRTFQRSRSGGTTTKVDLIRRHALELGDPDEAPVGKGGKAPPRPRSGKTLRHAGGEVINGRVDPQRQGTHHAVASLNAFLSKKFPGTRG